MDGTMTKYSLSAEDALKTCYINEKTRKRILKGEYYPTKNLIFTLALTCGFSEQDTDVLMQTCGFVYDYAPRIRAALRRRKAYEKTDCDKRRLREKRSFG